VALARLQDVVDAVVHGVNAGEEARPRRPGVRGDGGAQHVPLTPVDQGLEVGQRPLLQQGIEHAAEVTRVPISLQGLP
jgi:hypothetical protein